MNPSGHGLMFLRLGAVAMVLTACATGPTTPDSIGSTPEAPASLAASSPGKLVELLELETAAQVFLAAMCPTEMELHNVENVAIAAGGWTEASPSKVRRAASQAVTAVGQSAELLVQETRWPPELERDMRATTDELLALASPLQGLSEARSGAEMERYWTRIEKASRVAEQRLRLSLGLGLARSADDGCPPAPRVSRPKPESASPPSPQSGQTPRPATGPMPILTGPMIESTSDAICYLDPYAMPPLVGTNSDPWATRLIQIFAVMNGFNPGPIDGQYGPNTVAAVIQLQRLVGVVPDGQVGPITWGALSRYHCPR